MSGLIVLLVILLAAVAVMAWAAWPILQHNSGEAAPRPSPHCEF